MLRQDMALVDEVETGWYAGVGTNMPEPIIHQPWQPNYAGGQGIDTVIAREDWSLRISTGIDGDWYGARTTLDHTDLSETALSFSFRVQDWNELDRLMVMFSSNADFSDYFGINLSNYFAKPVSGEWIDIVLDTSEFEVIAGQPDWANITDMAVRVVPKAGESTRVWFDEFQKVKKNNDRAVISLTFDDGFASVPVVADIMAAHNMKGTAFVIPDFLGTEGYMTQTEVDALAASGWDISGHGKDNLVTLSPVDVDAQLALMHEYLETNGYQGAEHFAYPNGGYSRSVKSQILEYFSSARTIDGFQQTEEYIYPINVNAVTVSLQTPVKEVIAEIDQAIENNTWLILVWHDLNASPDNDIEYHINDFEWIIKYIESKSVEVEPYSVAYASFAGQ